MNANKRNLLTTMMLASLFLAGGCRDDGAAGPASGGVLEGLARPHHGRSMRATSTMRLGELRRGPEGDRNAGERRYDPSAEPRGDADVRSNWDNFNVPPGATHVLLDAQGPGVITHIWITFLGPEPADWAPQGSADHQELMLRMFWDGNPRPAVEAPVGDFFANCFGQRSEVISLPVIVEDADSYNCFWRMPFRKSARIEIENQSEKPLSLLYYNIDWIRLDSLPKDTPYFYAQYRQEYPVRHGPGLRAPRNVRARDITSARSWACGRAARPGSARATRRSTSTAKRSPRSGARAPRTTSSRPGASRRRARPTSACRISTNGAIDGHTSAYRWHLHDPVVFNTGIKVTLEHMGWISARREPRVQVHELERARGRLLERGLLVPDGRPTFAERAPGAERAPPAQPGQGHRPGPRPRRRRATREGGGVGRARGIRRRRARDAPLPTPGTGRRLDRAPVRGRKRRSPCASRSRGSGFPEGGRYQAFLDGVKLGRPLDFYAGDRAAREFPLLDFWPDPGAYVLRLECIGQDANSTGHALAIDSIRLLVVQP